MEAFFDLGDHEEDSRIDIIGKAVMDLKNKVGFVTDSDPGKADRYIKKLKERFPGIVVLKRGKGPVEGTEYVCVGPPPN